MIPEKDTPNPEEKGKTGDEETPQTPEVPKEGTEGGEQPPASNNPPEGETPTPPVDYKKKFGDSTRENQRIEEENAKLLGEKAKLEEKLKSKPPSEEEMSQKYPDWEFMDADEKIKARANISNEKRLQRLEEKSAWDDDYKKILDKFPELAKHEEEFKKEAYKHPKTVDLETIAKSFLYEPKSETPEPPEVPETPKLGLERPTAGGGNLPSSKLTVETLRDLRKNDHKRYLKVIQAKDFVMPKE